MASALAISGTACGLGPFSNPAQHEGLIQLQAFMAIVALTGLFLGAVTAERQAQRHAARVQLLADAARAYGGASVDLRGTLETVVCQIASSIGDGASIRLRTADGRALETVAVYHPNPELQATSLHLGAELQEVEGTLTGTTIRCCWAGWPSEPRWRSRTRMLLRTQEAIRMRDEFLSIASHELRTLLSALSLQLAGMRRLLGTLRASARALRSVRAGARAGRARR